MQLDENFGKKCKEGCFYPYDFNKADEIPKEMQGTFDMCVIDPPFITREVWEKYTYAVKLLLKKNENNEVDFENGKLLCSTIDENKEFMEELLGVKPAVFRPSIPNLVYQYNFYTNYEQDAQNEKNPEIPDME